MARPKKVTPPPPWLGKIDYSGLANLDAGAWGALFAALQVLEAEQKREPLNTYIRWRKERASGRFYSGWADSIFTEIGEDPITGVEPDDHPYLEEHEILIKVNLACPPTCSKASSQS